jgi:predicted Zn-ribbon and HTH transcriptional regulator
VEFEELVCYSQTVILILLAIGYIVNLRKTTSEKSKRAERNCNACGYNIGDDAVDYCAKCGELISHSSGLSLEK